MPIVYSVAWILMLWFAGLFLPKEIVSNPYFLVLYTIVFLFIAISKSTSWSIGHEKFGIKGDSRSRIINYHGDEDGKFWFDLFADNPEQLKEEKIQALLRLLVKEKDQNSNQQEQSS